jgi:hypothetical protein
MPDPTPTPTPIDRDRSDPEMHNYLATCLYLYPSTQRETPVTQSPLRTKRPGYVGRNPNALPYPPWLCDDGEPWTKGTNPVMCYRTVPVSPKIVYTLLSESF